MFIIKHVATCKNRGSCTIRVGWWISKVGASGVKWKLLGIETAVVKGFFSKIIILDNKWLLKIAKKMRKCIFLFNGPELERVLVFRPPLFFNFRGGHTSSILSNSCSFLRYAFLGLKFIVQNNDFWEKSFYYSSFYAQKLSFDSNVTHFWNSSTNPIATVGYCLTFSGTPCM